MRKLIISAVAAVLATATFAASPAATQDWVRRYVATNVVSATTTTTNGVTYFYAGNAVVSCEEMNVPAIMLKGCSAQAVADGYTNGMYFAWNGAAYVNGQHIISAFTNRVFSLDGKTSRKINGYDTIVDENDAPYCTLRASRLQPGIAQKVIGGEFAQNRSGLLDSLFSLFVPSAFADEVPVIPEGAKAVGDYYYEINGVYYLYNQIEDVMIWEGIPYEYIRAIRQGIEAFAAAANLQRSVYSDLVDYGSIEYSNNDDDNPLPIRIAGVANPQNEDKYLKSTGGGVMWDSITKHQFNQSAFSVDSSGNVNLRGISDSGTAFAYRNNGSLTWQSLNSLTDGATIKDNNGVLSLYNPPGAALSGARMSNGKLVWGAITGAAVDGIFIVTNNSGVISLQLQGKCDNSLAEFLKDGDAVGHKILTQIPGGKGQGAVPHWTPIGQLDLGPQIDGRSIVTNAEDHAGELAIAGFHEADSGALPYRAGDALSWLGKGDSGAILSGGDVPSWTKTEAKRHYYGTAENGTGLGWWELPNIVTNAVEADELTITDRGQEQGIKRFGFKAYPPAMVDGVPYGAYMTADGLAWAKVPVGVVTNETVVDNVFITTNAASKISLNLDGPCDTSISEMLQNGDELGHKFLAQIPNGDGAAIPHWTPLGEILPPSGGGGAIRFVGTDGEEAVVGSGATTNSVTFASAIDSNVKVSVAGEGGDVTITIGVYYK